MSVVLFKWGWTSFVVADFKSLKAEKVFPKLGFSATGCTAGSPNGWIQAGSLLIVDWVGPPPACVAMGVIISAGHAIESRAQLQL